MANEKCSHCLGSGTEPVIDEDLGGDAVTNNFCSRCKGTGTEPKEVTE